METIVAAADAIVEPIDSLSAFWCNHEPQVGGDVGANGPGWRRVGTLITGAE